ILKGLNSVSPALRGTSYAGFIASSLATLKGLNTPPLQSQTPRFSNGPSNCLMKLTLTFSRTLSNPHTCPNHTNRLTFPHAMSLQDQYDDAMFDFSTAE